MFSSRYVLRTSNADAKQRSRGTAGPTPWHRGGPSGPGLIGAIGPIVSALSSPRGPRIFFPI